MGWIGIIEAAPELLPRRWKSAVGWALALGFLLFPNAGREFMAWYVREKTQELVEVLMPLLQQSSPTS
jgi:hypothetical protein